MKIEKKLWITLFAFGMFAICFSGWIFSQSTVREKLFWDNTIKCETKELTDGEIKSKNIALPKDFNVPKSILFKTTHTIAEVWLDGEKIYEYGNEEDAPSFMKSPGSCWHIVDIPEDSAGKNLEVRIIPVYNDYYGNEVSIVCGTRGDCILKILTDSFQTLLLSCGILFASIICLLLYLGAVRRKRRDKTEAKIEIFLNLGFFSLLIAIWTLAQCGFLQFLIPDGRTLYFIDYFSFFLFPVPFNFLLYDICKSRYHKGALIFPILYLVNMAADVLLQCTGVIDIFRLLPATHVIMAANAVYAVTLIFYEARKEGNDEAKKFQYPMCAISVFGMAEMFLYYLRKFQQTSILLPIGTLLFIIMLIWIQVSQYYDQYIRKQKVIYLQKIANMDMLTEAMNRNAYEDMVKYLDEGDIKLRTTGVVLFDLDNLKVINDNFGHEKGDEALKLCYQCISQAFQNVKNCFRIGGDEFAYVYHSDEKDMIPERLKALELILKKTAETHKLDYPLSMSAGYAYYQPDIDFDFKDIVRRSDTMLYRQKRRKKMAQSTGLDKMLSRMGKQSTEEITDEVILQEKKFQSMSVDELCSVIDLFSPTTDNYPYVVDFRSDFYYIANQALERFCIPKNGFHNVISKHKEFVYAPDYEKLKAEFDDLLETDRCTHSMEYRWLDLKKMPVWIHCKGYLVRDDNMKPLYMIGCVNEIGERQKADNVSGLLGESGFREYMNQQDTPLETGYLLCIGIDHFKEINDKFGLEYGDFVLKKTAECISGCISEGQMVYKLVADEFLILDVSSDEAKDADKLYDKVREAIDRFIETNEFKVMYTVSGGIVPFAALKGNQCSEALKLTDFALNEAKKLGRNRCYIFNGETYRKFLRKREITQELREAVINGFQGFTAFYQPVFAEDKKVPYGAEALMRFTSEKFGMISPAEFIPILEETGLIIPAGRWMMKEAIGKCSEIRKILSRFRMSINISQIQASKSDVIQDFSAEMKRAGLPLEAVIVELTESDLLEQNINEKHFLAELKRMGISLALDDFGTGYSNFHYLSELKPEIIKIDRSFTAKAVADEQEYYLLNQFCTMIHNLDMKICIEGIESAQEWLKIRKLCPEFTQGYFWGKPCGYEEFVRKFVQEK